MGRPARWWYNAKDVEEATEEILGELQILSHRNKVFYVDGWNGFGATTVLRSIAAVLPSRKTTPELCFDRLIFVDCSKWKNRREVQRVIAEELKLDYSIMGILDKQDEEDDFNGIDESSRNEVDSVGQVIDQTLSGTKFVVIFLNGSDAEVDVGPFGIPRFARYDNNMMIWTFNRSCLTIHPEHGAVITKLSYTHVFFYPRSRIKEFSSSQFRRLLNKQADTIVARLPCMLDIDPTVVADCCLYELFLHSNFHIITRFDWVAHASNYWTCDAIIQGDRARDIGIALHREINWWLDEYLLDAIEKFRKKLEPPFLVIKDGGVYEEGSYRWISVTSENRKLHGLQTIPAATSSFFLAFEGSDYPSILPNGLFEHSNKLGVLVLYFCAFNFASPPFHKCQNLKFLGLDNCTDDKTVEVANHIVWTCLHSLMVLDLRYTDWDDILSEEKMDLMTNIRELNIEGGRCWQYTAQLQRRLPNLERLRIIRPTRPWEKSNDVVDSFIDKTSSIEILDLSGNSDMKILPTSLSKASSLQMLVLDGCAGLENIGQLPPSLKSFSFDGYGPSQHTPTVELPPEHFRPSIAEDEKDISTSKISLEGCTQLVNLFLRGLNNLVELDLSGTAIKILDFNTMVVQVPGLKRLFLIGCKHLRAIIFLSELGSSELKPDLELLCIDTRAGIVCPRPSMDKTKPFRLQVHAIVVDARFAYSLMQLFFLYRRLGGTIEDVYYNIHVTSSPVYDGVVQFEETNKEKFDHHDQGSLQQLIPACQYSDVLSMVGDPPTWRADWREIAEGSLQAFPQPPATQLDRHIEIAEGSCYVESGLEGDLGYLMRRYAESMYVHDVSIHAIIRETEHWWWWDYLRWCRVERCPKLDTVFPSSSYEFDRLETFWASDLLMARWICSKGSRDILFCINSFSNLQHLHLRSCPSLQFVLPVWVSSFPSLKTLHIIHCGDLVHLFELDGRYPGNIISLGVLFPKLATIHLHDLPKLQQICEVKMVAPKLETINIRGCWSLRRLPSVEAHGRDEKKPTVEIEKEVWDALEWDAGHRRDHFKVPVHSRHYKKKLPRVSVLR